MLALDHLAIVCADLQQGVNWAEARLGVPFQSGGQHPRFGTHNRLLGLADGLYLEVISPDPDPDAVVTGPRWFGLDHPPQSPQLGNWICQAENLDKHAPHAGHAIALSRGDLEWQITVPTDGSLPYGGAFPTLIKWGVGSTHPSATLAPSGLRLTALHVHCTGLAPDLSIDPRVVFHPHADRVKLTADFETDTGGQVSL